MGAIRTGGRRSKKFYPQIEQFQHFLNRYCTSEIFFDGGIGFVSISSVKVFIPTCVIKKKDRGDEHKFCTLMMEKTVSEIGILNSD
jgi:hypothetical protein